jgi:FAD:protein FMN transferase
MSTATTPARIDAELAVPAGASWTALGCTIHLLVTEPAALDDAKALLVRELDSIDRACSRFRPDSELSAVNAAGGREVQVGPVFVGAVGAALDAARATGGDVDPTLGAPLREAGYDRDFASLPADGPVVGGRIRIIRVPTWSQIVLDPDRGTVRVPEGVELDLGATAKAWCADRAADLLHSELRVGVLVSLGGDIAVRGPVPDGGWVVRVQEHPGSVDAAPAGPSCVVSIGKPDRAGADGHVDQACGLATSSTTARRWRRGGRLMHHIIDPRTGMPAVGQWRTVSVAAPTCLAANVQSTAAIVRSASAIEQLASSGLPAWLVDGDGAVATLNGWPGQVVA